MWFLPYLQLLLLLHLLLLLTLLESGFRSKFSRTSWKLHGFCVFFGKCRIFMISFHFVVRTLHKLHLLGLAEQPQKKKKVRLLLPAVPSSSDFYFIAFAVCTSTSCCLVPFVCVEFCCLPGSRRSHPAGISFNVLLFC